MPRPWISELLSGQISRFPRSLAAMRPHRHPFHQLDVVLEGSMRIQWGERSVRRAGPGDAWLIPPLGLHCHRIAAGMRQATFKFHLSPEVWRLFGNELVPFSLPSWLRMALQAQKPGVIPAQPAAAWTTLCLAVLRERRGRKVDRVSVASPHDAFRQTLWPLLEQVLADPAASWSVDSLAKACHLSHDYFSRRFRQEVGMTPGRFVQEARFRKAATLLGGERGLPIKEIAEQVGYADVHAFTRAFTRVAGMSPGVYRRQDSLDEGGG